MAVAVTVAAANCGRLCRDTDIGEATSAWRLQPRMAAFCIVRMDRRVRLRRAGLQSVSRSGRRAHDALAGRCCARITDVRVRRNLCGAANDYCLYGLFVSRVLGKGANADVWGINRDGRDGVTVAIHST